MIDTSIKRYNCWRDAVEDLQSQGVEYIGWANGGAKANKVLLENGEFEHPVSVPQGDFGNNTTVFYYRSANQVLCVDMS